MGMLKDETSPTGVAAVTHLTSLVVLIVSLWKGLFIFSLAGQKKIWMHKDAFSSLYPQDAVHTRSVNYD